MKTYETPNLQCIRPANGDIVCTSGAGEQLNVEGSGYGDSENY